MINTKLIEKLEKDLNALEIKIKYRRLYNILCEIISILSNLGIGINKLMPYILSCTIMTGIYAKMGDMPFKKDIISVKANIQTIETSNKEYFIYENNETKYRIQSLLYSTAWRKTYDGLFERKEISYNLNNKIDLAKELINNNYNDIDKYFEKTDERIIQKQKLDEEDYIYESNAYYLTLHERKDRGITRMETFEEMLIHSFGYICLCGLLGIAIKKGNKLFFKIDINSKFDELTSKYSIIKESDLTDLIKIRDKKLENLSMLDEEVLRRHL